MRVIISISYLISIGEESLDDGESLVVDGLVLVGLQCFYPVQAAALLHHHGHLVSLPELLGRGQDVAHPVQHHVDNLVILGSQQVAEWLENSLRQF